MFKIRQIEISAVTFAQYNNRISELVYHESSTAAVDGFYYFLNKIITETKPHQSIYLLSDLSQTGPLPLAYHFSKIEELNKAYDPHNRPFLRMVNLYEEVDTEKKLIKAFMETRKISGFELEMYGIEERERAILWLLRDV